MEHLDPELLSAYIDHELPAADAAAVERHLAVCETCRAEYEELRGLSTLVRELPIYEPKRVIDISAHPRGGSDTLAKIIAFSKPLAVAAVVLLVAFAGLRLLNDDEPEDSGDQISFSAVQPTEPGTEIAREASEGQAQEAPADAGASDVEAPAAAAPSDQTMEEAPADSAASDAEDSSSGNEVMGEAPPMGAMGAMPQGPPGTAVALEPEPVASPTAASTPAPPPAPESGVDSGNTWLPVAIVAAAIVALAGAAGWYRFWRPRRRGT